MRAWMREQFAEMKERVKREEHFQREVASLAWDEVRGWPALCRAACFMNHRMVEFLSWLSPQRIACTHARSIVFNLGHQLPACPASDQYFCKDKRKTKLERAQHFFFFCIVVLYSSDCSLQSFCRKWVPNFQETTIKNPLKKMAEYECF